MIYRIDILLSIPSSFSPFLYVSDLWMLDMDKELRHNMTVKGKLSLCRDWYFRILRVQKET